MKLLFQTCGAMLLGCGAFLFAQDRATFRQLSEAWQQTEPTLEHDAGVGGPQFEARARSASSAETAYAKQRREFLVREGKRAAATVAILQAIDAAPDSRFALRPESEKVVSASAQLVGRTSSGLAGSKDPAVIRVRQAVELERVALASIAAAIDARQKASDATNRASTVLETSQSEAVRAYRAIADSADRTTTAFGLESEAWDAYYAALVTAAGSPASSSGVIGLAKAVGAPVATVTATPRNTIPATRYVGDWSFPATGLFHGPEPEKVDMSIQLENNRLTGTLTAKFKVPEKSSLDPVVKIEFSGAPVEGRTQTFALKTKEGAQGTIDLIPGRAFNLLEVNFQINPIAPGQLDENKISTANFVLLKQ